MTKSPVSTWGAKIGLCLPRSKVATTVARRPRGMLAASITHHWRSTSTVLGAKVLLFIRSGSGRAEGFWPTSATGPARGGDAPDLELAHGNARRGNGPNLGGQT